MISSNEPNSRREAVRIAQREAKAKRDEIDVAIAMRRFDETLPEVYRLADEQGR